MHVSPEGQREMLRTMQTIRRFEERASADYHAGNIYGVVHCYVGEEAVAAGVCAALAPDDQPSRAPERAPTVSRAATALPPEPFRALSFPVTIRRRPNPSTPRLDPQSRRPKDPLEPN